MRYAGFWRRAGAALIDAILWSLIIIPLSIGITINFGAQVTESIYVQIGENILIFVVVMAFWFYASATPGKMMVKCKIVDSKTGGKPSKGQFVGRWFAYIIATLPLFLGIIWIAFDKRKQGWHDKLAGTLVVMTDNDDAQV